MEDIFQCYKILDLEPGASAERVRRAYVALFSVWDPEKHFGNPILQSAAKSKRQEIEQAYRALQRFMPELRADYDPPPPVQEQSRDFMEMSQSQTADISKSLIALFLAALLGLLFFMGYRIYLQTRSLSNAPPAAPDADVTPDSTPAPSAS